MPLDTSIIRQATFQPMAFNQPSRMNELAQAAQAVGALQGLQQNALAMRQAQEQQARVSGMTDVFKRLSQQSGETPDVMLKYSDALIESGVPQYVTAGIALRQKVMQHIHDSAIEREAERLGASAGTPAAVAPAPVAAPVVAPEAAPVVRPAPAAAAIADVAPTTVAGLQRLAPNVRPPLTALTSIYGAQPAAPVAVPAAPVAANALATGPGLSDMIAGGAKGTATTQALPEPTLNMPAVVNPNAPNQLAPQAGGQMTPELADAMLAGGGQRPLIRLQPLTPQAPVAGKFSLQAANEYVKTFPALIRDLESQIPRVRTDSERATLRGQLKEAQDTLAEAQRIVRGATAPGAVAPRATPVVAPISPPAIAPVTPPQQPAAQPAPAATQTPAVLPAPAAAAAPVTRVAGPMVAGALPESDEAATIRKKITDLEAKRAVYARMQDKERRDAKIKDINDQIRELNTDLREIRRAGPEIMQLVRQRDQLAAQGRTDSATYRDLQARINRLTEEQKGTSVKIELPAQEKAFESELGQAQAKKIMADKNAAEDAVSIIETARRGRELLSGPMITGFGAEFLTSLGSALNQAGFSFAADSVANTQTYASNMAQNVAKLIKQFGAGTGLSNEDRNYAEKMAGGKISLDKPALLKILEINERAATNVINRHNKNVEGVKTNIPLRVELPPAIQPNTGTILSAPSAGQRPSGVGADWTLKQDARGNRAWVSPDGKRFVEVK